jgi:hypothetical protein
MRKELENAPAERGGRRQRRSRNRSKKDADGISVGCASYDMREKL